jgi:hypothetical protein
VLRRQWSNYKDVYRSAEPKPHREDGNSKEKEKEKKKEKEYDSSRPNEL